MNEPKVIKVFIVDDSLVFRSFLTQRINADKRFQVIGTAVDAFDAAKQIPELKPDVVTLDIEMPGMNGLDFLSKLIPTYPVPVILVSTISMRVFDALAAGAIDYVRKPEYYDGDSVDSFVYQLKPKLVIASRAKVHQPSAIKEKSETIIEKAENYTEKKVPILEKKVDDSEKVQRNLIAIGASTGGTEAILEVCRHLPADAPGVVIAQHMPTGFTGLFAERLDKLCQMEVREAKHGDKVKQGLILVAPGGKQTRVIKRGADYWVTVSDEDKVNGVAPSVDVLFNSVSQAAGKHAIGVILTGMGSDGAVGLLKMHKDGAYTIGQDESSCVVYGMPMEAKKIGALDIQASLINIEKLIEKSYLNK